MNEVNMICENEFDLQLMNKYASLMALGNGYLGLRSCHEEDYEGQTRGMYVAGIYNQLSPSQMTKIVNLPDLVGMEIEINGDIFSNESGQFEFYDRKLNMLTGELIREVIWKNKDGNRFHFLFQRFVSKDDLHLFASKVTVTALDCNALIKIKTGINAECVSQEKNELTEELVKILDKRIMHGVYQTTESNHKIAIATSCISPDQSEVSFFALNNQLLTSITQELVVEKSVKFEKISSIFTSNDMLREEPAAASVNTVQKYLSEGYDKLRDSTTIKWQDFWKQKRIEITSKDKADQLGIDFSLYHIEAMTPIHDDRMSIGSRGLTGEGNNGLIFWNTEMFISPFHLFTEPEISKKLLRYRYHHIQEAKANASLSGYEGALFPWASAFTGKEESLKSRENSKRSNIVQNAKLAKACEHVVADIAFSVVQYYENTLDESFMASDGLELLKETARFWVSRTTDKGGDLFIKNVIGPDEFTELVDNNAYTNYMAFFNVQNAMNFMDKYNDQDAELAQKCKDFLKQLYLPQPNDENIIPQDDTFLSKPEIDLTEYRQSITSREILLDYSLEDLNELQVLKQADVVLLLYLFPDLFSTEIVKKNLEYYEERTVHDTPISKSIHAIVAARCDYPEEAYQLFQEGCLIDLGPNPKSSDEGIHAASMGVNWLVTIFGFANISMDINRLKIDPKLPKNWEKIAFPFLWQGSRLEITIAKRTITITKESGPPVSVEINGETYNVTEKIKVSL
ncbi:glycoside hydrolase family 65 protein [Bacillus sp. AFS041924]|uniref:glycoside hydrolase family 65 protein n=1 Tax=Bacillus sp. AFS041924 TaxID=2033503 RepID=UPI000BFC0EB1|nr:glycosyl hydrolase family 65 protein [Bacillus sp. AFS041924]PGS56542.1 glycosyl hydrolase family 65 [Bacillus sp. AFS041924]